MRMTHGRLKRMWPFPSAFTLIEMLTVIAIIGILAAILLPTIGMIRRKAKMAAAEAGIGQISAAIVQYTENFGIAPPDSNEGLADDYFQDMDTPNECYVWFLTRSFDATEGAGIPGTADDGWSVPPQNALTVNARVTGGPYLDIREKNKRDYDGDNFQEHLDPWGRPYMYRAYLDDWRNVTGSSPDGQVLTLSLDIPAELQGLEGVRGRVQLRGFDPSSFNGTFDFEGSGTMDIDITFAAAVGDPTTDGEFRFLLHNNEDVDIYSLGPNGRTRGGDHPLTGGNPVEWKPQIDTEYGKWNEVWGTPGDGNDVANTGNIGIIEERDLDDVNNW